MLFFRKSRNFEIIKRNVCLFCHLAQLRTNGVLQELACSAQSVSEDQRLVGFHVVREVYDAYNYVKYKVVPVLN
jgi:hypothetical protein